MSAQRLRVWLRENAVDAEFLAFDSSVHSVDQAVTVSGFAIEFFTKSIVMVTPDQRVVIAVVPADSRASTERVKKALALDERPRAAIAAESLQRLGQTLGGNHPFDAPSATVLLDPKVAAREWILVGGGDEHSLVKISLAELRRIVPFVEARVRK